MRWGRSVGITTGVLAAAAASFAAGWAVATPAGEPGSPPDGRATVAAGPRPVAAGFANDDLAPADSCDELLDWYVERGVERVGPWGWESRQEIWMEQGVFFDGVVAADAMAGAPVARATSGALPQRATSGESGTNVQEAGVDEPDVVKVAGGLLVRVQDGDLVTYDVTGDPERLGSLDLPGIRAPELLLSGDRVLVTGTRTDEDDRAWTRVLVADVSDPGDPTVVDDASYDAELVTARLHGGTARVVLAAALPDLDFVRPRTWLRGDRSAEDHNQDVVRDSKIEDWLPTVTRDGETEPLLDCADVAVPADGSGLGTLAVVGLDPAAPETWSADAVATDSRTTYFSTDRMVLATSASTGWWPVGGCCVDGPDPEDDGTTHLYSFALEGLDTAYVASGTVDGAIRDRWSMDEAGGVLRVAVGETTKTGNFNSVVTLEEDGDDLVELGRVDKLGVGEDIKSVRWFDRLAFVVTFRQVDPLYAVDLTDPAAPRLLGKLKVPGFSEYLHPLGQHRLLGVGQGPGERGRWGAQAAVFNVSDLTDPRRIDVVSYGGNTRAGVATDPRQLTWLPDSRTLLTVVSKGWTGRTGWVSVLTLDGGPIENRMVEVEYGDEVEDVRTVPLADGRVLLVTGEDVSDFPL